MQDNFNDNGWGCAYRSLQVYRIATLFNSLDNPILVYKPKSNSQTRT